MVAETGEIVTVMFVGGVAPAEEPPPHPLWHIARENMAATSAARAIVCLISSFTSAASDQHRLGANAESGVNINPESTKIPAGLSRVGNLQTLY